MSRIFISYRRGDTAADARLIYSHLESLFEKEVFMDIDDIEVGDDFVEAIEEGVSRCDVVIAVIGRHWMGERGGRTPRIENENDYVRLEIEAALNQGKRIVPVLVDEAKMPSVADLPESLQPLVRRNALQLSHTRFRFDLKQLSDAVIRREVVKPEPVATSGSRLPGMAWVGILAGVLLAGGVSYQWFTGKQLGPKSAETRAVTTSMKPVEKISYCDDNPCPEMVRIPGGVFQMGSNEGTDDEKPTHTVLLSDFEMSETEVTFNQYDTFAKVTGRRLPDDGGWGRGDRPVINVSWNDATDYIVWLNEETGDSYRLPTETEWEYAARSRTTGPFYTGDCISTEQANYDGTHDYNDCGAGTGVYRGKTVPVKTFSPNAFGLFDTAGNVWEWVKDCWHDSYVGVPTDGSAWLESHNGDCNHRVLRGGGWNSNPGNLRAALRGWNNHTNANNSVGFRLVRTL